MRRLDAENGRAEARRGGAGYRFIGAVLKAPAIAAEREGARGGRRGSIPLAVLRRFVDRQPNGGGRANEIVGGRPKFVERLLVGRGKDRIEDTHQIVELPFNPNAQRRIKPARARHAVAPHSRPSSPRPWPDRTGVPAHRGDRETMGVFYRFRNQKLCYCRSPPVRRTQHVEAPCTAAVLKFFGVRNENFSTVLGGRVATSASLPRRGQHIQGAPAMLPSGSGSFDRRRARPAGRFRPFVRTLVIVVLTASSWVALIVFGTLIVNLLLGPAGPPR